MGRYLICAFASTLAAGGAAYAVPPDGGTSAKALDQRDRVICRRFLRTGSLVDSYRTCKTRAEWDREHENLQHLSVSDSCTNRRDCDPWRSRYGTDRLMQMNPALGRPFACATSAHIAPAAATAG